MTAPGLMQGRTVLVTGGTGGIGRATADALAGLGARVGIVGRDLNRAQRVADEIRTPAGRDAVDVFVADLSSQAEVRRLAEAVLTTYRRLDVLVNNVGGTIWAKPFQHYTTEQITAEVQRSLFPTLWTCRAALPHLVEQGSGVIVNVSSVATRGVNRVPYAAAKGGVNAITASLALEAAQYGVRVVATAPGGTDAPERRVARGPSAQTDQELTWYQQIVDQTVDSSLMKRYGTLDEQAAAIVFLASDEASYITGTVLPVAGGDLG